MTFSPCGTSIAAFSLWWLGKRKRSIRQFYGIQPSAIAEPMSSSLCVRQYEVPTPHLFWGTLSGVNNPIPSQFFHRGGPSQHSCVLPHSLKRPHTTPTESPALCTPQNVLNTYVSLTSSFSRCHVPVNVWSEVRAECPPSKLESR